MKPLLLLLWVIPCALNAQINRSATEVAKERTEEYVVGKLFRGLPYKPLSYGELKPYKESNPETAWWIEHKCEVNTTPANKASTPQVYKLTIYFDKRMRIIKAESSTVNKEQ